MIAWFLVRDRAVEVALAGIGIAAVVIDHRIAGVEQDRLVVALDGAIIVTLVVERITAVVECERIGRVELDRLIKVRERLVGFALHAIGDTGWYERAHTWHPARSHDRNP